MEKVYKFEESTKITDEEKRNLEVLVKDLTNSLDKYKSIGNNVMIINEVKELFFLPEKKNLMSNKESFQKLQENENFSKNINSDKLLKQASIKSIIEDSKESAEKCKIPEKKENLKINNINNDLIDKKIEIYKLPKEEHKIIQEVQKENLSNIVKIENSVKITENKEKIIIKTKPEGSKIVKKSLGIDQNMFIKSPRAERNINKKESGSSLKFQIPNNILITLPDDFKFDCVSTANFPDLSYKLLIQESEPQECNPKDNYFIKSGVNSRRFSKLSEMKKPVKQNSKKDNVENEMDKIITEKLKNGEDFDSILKEMNIKINK